MGLALDDAIKDIYLRVLNIANKFLKESNVMDATMFRELEAALPSDIVDSQLYKQFGNSVCINVVEKIAKNILIALEN